MVCKQNDEAFFTKDMIILLQFLLQLEIICYGLFR